MNNIVLLKEISNIDAQIKNGFWLVCKYKTKLETSKTDVGYSCYLTK